MIDLHCHILPGLDDGATDLGMALAMARLAVADGVVTVACTPHIMPGVYNNTGPAIRAAVEALLTELEHAEIPLQLTTGADVHVDPALASDLASGKVLTLADSRYFLFEPPHHVAPPKLDEFAFRLLTAGYVPVLTHPERLSWVESHFAVIQRMAEAGVLIQITAASILGDFGRSPRYWAERMVAEGMADLLASDAHDVGWRPPKMGAARDAVAKRWGDDVATRLTTTNPLAILKNVLPSQLRQPAAG